MIPIYILVIEDENDREYMSFLYIQYHKLMYKTIKMHTSDPWLADDIMQTTFEKLIGKIALLKTLSQDRLANYIITACKNNTYNAIRAQKHYNFEDEEDIKEFDAPWNNVAHCIEIPLLRADEIASLKRIWPLLKPRSQYLLSAKYILDKNSAEIAKDLNMKPESVRMALTRARKEAYSLLKKDEAKGECIEC